MKDFEETYRRLKTGLERAYMWSMGRKESRDAFYEEVEAQLLRARVLHRIGDENGVREVLRRVAKALPTVNLKTPDEENKN